MKVSIIGIDLAKEAFQVTALNQAGKEVMNRRVRRNKLLDVLRQFEPTFLAIEACGSSHYWGRVFRRMGHDVRLIPPQHVKAFTRVNKTVVALANKMARIAWVIVARGERFDMNKAFG